MDLDPEPSPWKYLPFELGECEDLENYEPGGFHPVHLGDVFDDGRYKVVHKLGFGGFSTVWLARDTTGDRWVAVKIIVARESPTYEARSTIASHPSIAGSRLFSVADKQFWINRPNGRHLCLVMPVLGPSLAKLSKGIYSRIKAGFAKGVSLQAAQALAHLHANGLCHGDFTVHNIALHLADEFESYSESRLIELFGLPQTAPVRTYSGKPPRPHAPDCIVVPLDFCSSNTTVLSRDICVIDFDQSFTARDPPSDRLGIPANSASDIWALVCAIFRIRSGDDLFFDYDTDCPADALQQIVKTMGDLPQEWKETKFDEDGFAVAEGKQGEPIWSLKETRPLKDRVDDIIDEPPSLFISSQGEAVEAIDTSIDDGPDAVVFDEEFRIPYPATMDSMVWKPTAICVDGDYFAAYSDETDEMLKAFPRKTASEAALLSDLLSKTFTCDPAKRITAEELITHAWFCPAVGSD
ncbi:kinase-like domain-containing protein [Podospora aff. communis PSN243]|uniref:non-specific serine/threonine protein kinase n=1 Tax=Podospora aff. communis PSN243 TaxID=3040156 RepID=A0AAV9GQZ2_9PEZI|nr:kinase-like domain-containing protein [Podospora aff. communis PSN243]